MLEENVQTAIESQLRDLADRDKLMTVRNPKLEGGKVRPDLVTSRKVIEIKKGENWHQGLGQILRDCWLVNQALYQSRYRTDFFVERIKSGTPIRGAGEEDELQAKTAQGTPKTPWLILFDCSIYVRELAEKICEEAGVGLVTLLPTQTHLDDPEAFFKPEIDFHKQLLTRHYLGELMPAETASVC